MDNVQSYVGLTTDSYQFQLLLLDNKNKQLRRNFDGAIGGAKDLKSFGYGFESHSEYYMTEQKEDLIKIVPEKSWVYITFIKKNLFINVYNEIDGKKVAIKFWSLSTFIPKSNLKTKIDPSRVELFGEFIAEWLKKWNAKKLVVVFREEAARVNIRSRNPIWRLIKKRRRLIKALRIARVPVASFIELSPIPYNGCKTKHKKRGRQGYVRRIFDKKI